MERKEYSAGAVKVCFWFSEFRKVVTLLDEGNSMEDVKDLNQRKNIFSAPSQSNIQHGFCPCEQFGPQLLSAVSRKRSCNTKIVYTGRCNGTRYTVLRFCLRSHP